MIEFLMIGNELIMVAAWIASKIHYSINIRGAGYVI